VFLILGIALAAAVLVLLTLGSAKSEMFSDNFPLLLALAGGVAAALGVLVGILLWRLRRSLRQGIFGAKLSLRLVWMFGLMALLPGAVVYALSVHFLEKTIDSWFDVRVDHALQSGVALGRSTLDSLLADLARKADSMAYALSEEPPSTHVARMDRLREQAAVAEAVLVTSQGRLIGYAGAERMKLAPELPDLSLRGLDGRFARIESGAGDALLLKTIVPVHSLTLADDDRYLMLVQPVSDSVARDAQAVQDAFGEYQAITVSRLGLKRMFGFTLTLALLIILLLALVLAFYLSERMGAPLRALVRGTRAIAKGDFSQMQPVESRDELGLVIHSFNRMTRQLAEAREVAERHQTRVGEAKAYLEQVLTHLASGVLTLDDGLRVRTLNPSALEILGLERVDARDIELDRIEGAPEGLAMLARAVREHLADHIEGDWQTQLDYIGPAGMQTLLLRGTRLPSAEASVMLVFDDITHLIRAERDAAWGEVARRLAHEIRNPLTPIQLSAERMRHKLAAHLSPADAEFLERATQTIVNQVAAMKSMVEAFANYAKLPRAKLAPLDLNALVHEVVTLYEQQVDGLELKLGENLPRAIADAALLRQIIHNLLLNAQDALAGRAEPHILIETRVRGASVALLVSDNGPGFPEHLMPRLFEPYATTKAKGTGLGLAVVKKIVEEHHGGIEVTNIEGGGARVAVLLPVAQASPREQDKPREAMG
jgi:nitrogen fixation/metabolism regulation signal transduction histidine kinase